MKSKRSFARKERKMAGTKGIYTAVIATATKDVLYGEPEVKLDALRYFRSPEYRSHLEALDLPTDWLPEPTE